MLASLQTLVIQLVQLFFAPGDFLVHMANSIAPAMMDRMVDSESAQTGGSLAAMLSAGYWLIAAVTAWRLCGYLRALYVNAKGYLYRITSAVQRFMRVQRIRSACKDAPQDISPAADDTLSLEVVDLQPRTLGLLQWASTLGPKGRIKQRDALDALELEPADLQESCAELMTLQLIKPAPDQDTEYLLTQTGRFYLRAIA